MNTVAENTFILIYIYTFTDAKEGEACGGTQNPWCEDGLYCNGTEWGDDSEGICHQNGTL